MRRVQGSRANLPLLGVDMPLLAAHSILQSTAILAAAIWLIARAARAPVIAPGQMHSA